MKFLGKGPLEILAILIIALIVLGPDRMIKSARRLGEGLRELKKEMWKAEQYLKDDPIEPPSNLISNSNMEPDNSQNENKPITNNKLSPDETEPTKPPSS